jgi:protein gp37
MGFGLWGPGTERRFFGDKHWNEPLRWNKAAEKAGVRKRVFCASMSDVFEVVGNEETDARLNEARTRLWDLIARTPWLDWLLLTKRPENIAGMVPAQWMEGTFPENVWLGTTAETQERLDERIMPLLLIGSRAKVLFLSIEPMFGPMNLAKCYPHTLGDDADNVGYVNAFNGLAWFPDTARFAPEGKGTRAGISWVITGGESGHGARPLHPRWVEDIRDQCVRAGVAFHHKQWGEWAPNCLCNTVEPHATTPRPEPGPRGVMFLCGKKHSGRVVGDKVWDEMPRTALAAGESA